MAVAATRIKVGTKKDGFKFIEPGDTVSKDKFDEDEWKQLVESGAVVKSKDDVPPPTAESTHAAAAQADPSVGPESKTEVVNQASDKEAEEARQRAEQEQQDRLAKEGKTP